MRRILVTGAEGFIGRNLVAALERLEGLEVERVGSGADRNAMAAAVGRADFIYHLAGVNRPLSSDEYFSGNTDLTRFITGFLLEQGKKTPLLLSSSTQAAQDNPYGISKCLAEESVFEYAGKSGAPVYVYRLTNVFGKWCRPNYNSVVATFCHNISRNLDITISDPSKRMELVYIDDVVKAFAGILGEPALGAEHGFLSVQPVFTITLGELADRIRRLRDIRKSLVVPDLSDPFMRYLYATYLSHLDKEEFSYPLEWKADDRGSLAELIKSEHFGQMFVSRTRAGVIRGNHYHHTKVEKFCVLQGSAVIRFRQILGDEVLCYAVSGEKPCVVDIPPGYTHSIENTSDGELIVLFWASEIFDPERADTFFLPVETCGKQ